ncbi:hypothetical protein EWN99_23555 [Salmonella enterica]|nr:hypothetical protein [Salmonella enterica]EBS3176970.1 hypothetical protein [Salmonella enterica subsp. enterica serovar Newport]EBS3869046.1 hypothetical protein [Salmonella enterica subsp. enterica serovar Kimberley]EDL3629814.1 hypothetical protein [Salmonella enterica subsp. enterica serovar Newport]EGU8719268.1 hypothetical protein [Salmonella enterica]
MRILKLCLLKRNHHFREKRRRPASRGKKTGKSRRGKTGGTSAGPLFPAVAGAQPFLAAG